LFSPSGRVDGGQDPFADAPVMVVAHGEEFEAWHTAPLPYPSEARNDNANGRVELPFRKEKPAKAVAAIVQ